jgi:hypothetical protein
MAKPHRVAILSLIFSAAFAAMAQPGTNAPAPTTAPVAANAPVSTDGPAYADLLQPSLQSLHDTVMGLRFEKWKGGNVREEAGRDAGSIVTDVNQTLPGLIKDADAAPQRVGAALPLSQNVNALYAVALRVLDAARIAAPADQVSRLQDAANQLSAANKAVYERLANGAAAIETHSADLEARVKTMTVAAQAAQQAKTVPDCPAPPVKRTVRKKKPAAKSATTQQQSGTQNGNAQQKPQ